MPEGLTAVTGAFRVNTQNIDQQILGGLAYIDGSDVFAVSYVSFNDPSGNGEIMYREIDPAGTFVTAETQIAAGTYFAWADDLIQLSNGDVALIWTDQQAIGGSSTIQAILADAPAAGQAADFSADPTQLMTLAGVRTGSVEATALSNGSFAVGLSGEITPGPADDGMIRFFDGDGTPLSSINTVSDRGDRSSFLSLAQQIDGRVIALVQTDNDSDPDDTAILAQPYTTTGLPSGGAAQLRDPDPDVYAVYTQSLTALENGLVLETYTAATFTGGSADNYDIRGRILSPTGEVFQDLGVLSDTPTLEAHFQAAAATPDGGFVVVWRAGDDGNQAGFADEAGLYMRRFDVDGSPVGASLPVTPGATSAVDFPAVEVSPEGEVLVGWTGDSGSNFLAEDIYVRSYSLDDLGTTGVTRTGTDGNDRLTGTADDDTLTGGDGADLLDGGTGQDIMSGGRGNDIYIVDSRGDMITGELAFAAGGGIDTVRAFVDYVQPENIELVRLGYIDDTVRLNAIGNDAPGTLVGNAVANTLYGRGGDDQINGNGGWDVLVGNTGRDTLVGGAGRDTFVYTSIADSRSGAANRDVINGFDLGRDTIDLGAIDANLGGAGEGAFTFIGTAGFSGAAGELRLQGLGGANAVLVEGDVRGDGVADFQVFVNLVTTLGADDFIL